MTQQEIAVRVGNLVLQLWDFEVQLAAEKAKSPAAPPLEKKDE